MSADFGVTQTWGHSAQLSLSFHTCTMDMVRRGGVNMQQLIVSPLLVPVLVVSKVTTPLLAHRSLNSKTSCTVDHVEQEWSPFVR